MDDQRILHRSSFGRFQIRWDEIRRIETDAYGGTLVIKGDDKQLVIPGKDFWSGKNKKQMIDLFDGQIKRYQIEVERTMMANFAITRKCRMQPNED